MKRRRPHCRACGSAIHNVRSCPEVRKAPKPQSWVPLTPAERLDIVAIEEALARVKRSTAALDAATRRPA